jgi:hypothetical protein
MKKLIKTATIGLALCALSTVGLASNPLDDLLQSNVGQGACGKPTSPAVFCGCFMTQAIAACKVKGPQHGLPPTMCNATTIRSGIKSMTSASGFCNQYDYLIPSNVGHAECTTDIQYFYTQC